LSLQLSSGSPSYFALDNLTFAQVPEPSAIGLGILAAAGALGAAAMRRRKRA
jgi:MYXO-CTERM domain-containing protein